MKCIVCFLLEWHGMCKCKFLYFQKSIEIVSLEGLKLWCSEINKSKRPLAGDARLEDNDLPRAFSSFTVITSKTARYRYLFHSPLLTFHSLVELLLPTARLNGISRPISIEIKTVHGLNQAVFRT